MVKYLFLQKSNHYQLEFLSKITYLLPKANSITKVKTFYLKNVFFVVKVIIASVVLAIFFSKKEKAEAISCYQYAAVCSSSENVDYGSLQDYPRAKDTVILLGQLLQEESGDNGSPSLQRTPTQGESEFEPQRIPLILPSRRRYRSSPSITIINPSGYGASWGSAGIGIGLQQRARFVDEADGVFGFGFGLGDPNKYVGLQIGVTLVDLDNIFRDGKLNLKLHHRFGNDLSAAVGIQGFTTFGDTDGGSSGYGSITKKFSLKPNIRQPFSELYTTVGIGGGQFRSESDINNDVESLGVFGSVAVRVIEPMSAIAEWSGQDLTIGVSIVPFRKLPLVIIPAITDITGTAGDGARFVFGAGYSFSF